MTVSTPRATGEIASTAEGITVTVSWDVDVDRNRIRSWELGPRHAALAERLKRAIDAQAVCLDPVIERDVDGKTYVASASAIVGRTLNADLRRLGF